MALRDHEAVMSRGDLLRVDVDQLVFEPGFNVRDLETSTAIELLEQLEADIEANGVQVPIEIYEHNGKLIVTNGHRRVICCRRLTARGVEIASIPAIAAPKGLNDAERILRLVTLNNGVPLTQLEKAEVVRRLLAYGWDKAKIAQRFGYRTEQSISNLILLLEAPEAVKTAVREGEISGSAAVHLVRAEGDKSGEVLEQAKETAAARGKATVTPSSIPRARKGKHRSGRLPAATDAPTPHLGNQGKFDHALMLLREVIRDGYKIDTCATAYLGDLGDLGRVVQWMLDLEEELKDRRKAAQPQTQPTLID